MKNITSQYSIYCDLSFFLLCKVQVRKSDKHDDGTMMMMITAGKKRVIYTISEYQPLLDSSNMTMDDWIQVGGIQRKA